MGMKLKRVGYIIIQILCVTFLESVNALHVNEFCTSNQIEQLNLLVGKITDLNICRHRFGLKLLSSCSLMSEEEISKMSVNLLNCQSAIEGRQQFPCTDDMSLEECTHLMDPITRNTYAVIKMRALSVCDSVKMEMTINKLITATRDQLVAMRSLIQEYHIDDKGNHKELLKDCDEIKNSLHTILKGISSHIKLFRAKDDMLVSRHEDIININRKLNTTIHFLQEALDKFNHNFNALIWITNYATADQIELICIIVLHGIYLIVGLVIAKLMHASKLNKACLFLTVVLSLIMTLKNGIQDIYTYSVLIFTSVIEQLIMSAIQAYTRHNSRAGSTNSHSSTGGDTQIQTHTLVNSFKDQLWSNSGKSGKRNIPPSTNVANYLSQIQETTEKDFSSFLSDECAAVLLKHAGFLRERNSVYHPSSTHTSSRTSSRSDTPRPETPVPLCRAHYRSGQRCLLDALTGSEFCFMHGGSAYLKMQKSKTCNK